MTIAVQTADFHPLACLAAISWEDFMESRMLIGFVLIGIGILDFVVGNLIVLPQVRVEETRAKLRLAFVSATLLTIALGAAFLLGWISPTR
jgi:hypothetical protein